MIEFKQFHKAYKGKTVLRINELSLKEGVYWLKGCNGAGKSTLLRCMAGLNPHDGEVLIEGITIKKDRIQYCKHIRYAEADPTLPAFLTGDEIVKFYLETGACRKDLLDKFLELFEVKSYIGQIIGTFSSGMLKKLSLALVLGSGANVLLLDEPLITLDTAATALLLKAIEELTLQGTTIILTSHQDVEIPGLKAQQLLIENQMIA